MGEPTLPIHHAGKRIATHPLFPTHVRNACSTDASHMPEAFLKPGWDDTRIRGRVREIAPDAPI
ncbi:hypothetical protein [Ellagibacter isourolithinifaciens]|uniref:hypothetical protein n=1 Tax=Ellagibacter isourolithinifaciens TaxID=2137581 RepID=UPI003AAE5295